MMKLRPLIISIFGIALVFILSFGAFGQDTANYFALKAGGFSPTGDLDNTNFDTGFVGEVACGHYFYPGFALEIGVGYYKSNASVSGFDPVFLGAFREKDDVKVIPVTLTGKWIYPYGNFEFFGGIGAGVYFASFKGDLASTTLGTISVDENDSVFGMNLGFGVTYNITRSVFVGVESKWIWTGEAEFQGSGLRVPFEVRSDLDGIIFTANLGFRF
jgi:outer membrane protein W